MSRRRLPGHHHRARRPGGSKRRRRPARRWRLGVADLRGAGRRHAPVDELPGVRRAGLGCWAFGVFGWDGDAFHPGDHLWGYPGDCVNQPGGWTYFAGPYSLDLRGHQKVRMGVRCESAAGCATSSMETWANLKDVSVTVRDDSAPSLSANGGELLGDGWHRGTEWMWAAVRDNVGIRSVHGQLDGNGAFASQDFAQAGWPASVACDFARPGRARPGQRGPPTRHADRGGRRACAAFRRHRRGGQCRLTRPHDGGQQSRPGPASCGHHQRR